MFEPLPSKIDFPAAEQRVLAFWERERIFEASIAQREGKPRFVFYEGPPTANGLPHPGHVLTRAMKDLFPRYRTMCGYLVERKAGWDTHGLPVEREVCKELGIRTKQEIEAYGVEKFNLKCIQSVFRYTREWEEMTRRLGFWVNLREAYVTYHQSYVESVWWSLKTLFERGVLYRGHKVVWWWAQGGTALSSGEVGEGYRKVDDPSVFVKFPVARTYLAERPIGIPKRIATITVEEQLDRTWKCLQEPEATAKLLTSKEAFETEEGHINHVVALRLLASMPAALIDEEADELKSLLRIRAFDRETVEKLGLPRSLLVWTTTPWTLISNHFAAVNPDIEYALVHDAQLGENFYVAAALVDGIAKKVKRELTVLLTCKGSDVLSESVYYPPFKEAYFEQNLRDVPLIGWRIVPGDFVTTDSGTGIVHVAPAFGEADFSLLQKQRQEAEEGVTLPVFCAVDPNGTFNADAPERYRGRWVKECDKDIIRELRDERKTPWGTPLLFHQEVYNHDYPFCPQAPDDPLIQYARKSWFVRTSSFKDEFLKNNARIHWLPDHIQEGRFGDFLRNNVDWALSRERYWGTPLPIWVCEQTGKMEAIGSFAELQTKPGAGDNGYWERKVAEHRGEDFPDHLRVHKPYIDEWTYDSPFAAGARMRRVSEVIDCWWDAGSMPFAQWGYPHAPGSIERFSERFPADFISEAIDQTRGWFYGLLAISTLLFAEKPEMGGAGILPAPSRASDKAENHGIGPELQVRQRRLPHWEAGDSTNSDYPLPYRACVVLGLILGEDGNKMSKKLRNYKEPSYIFDTFGADAMRWYFYSAQAPWTSVRFQEAAIRDSQRDYLVKLYNVLSFFTIYASIDGFQAGPGSASPTGHRPANQRSELDRWIISELNLVVRFVRESMDRLENFPAAQRLNEFVDALSNWFVRRSRDRFWLPLENGPADQDKWDAYNTLYECLLTLSKLTAPFTPFFAEAMYQTLLGTRSATLDADTATGSKPTQPKTVAAPLSVHLCDYPTADPAQIDEALAQEMDLVRDIASLGRAARAAATVKEARKVRQPLARVEIVLANPQHRAFLEQHAPLLREELNVHEVEFVGDADRYCNYKVVPNFKAIGEKYRALVPKIKAALGQLADPAAALRHMTSSGTLPLPLDGDTVQLTPAEVDIRLEAKPGWAAAQGRAGVIILSTELTPELLEEGLVRELIHHIQQLRKDRGLAYQDRIRVLSECDEQLAAVFKRHAEVIQAETLATELLFASPARAELEEVEIEGRRLRLGIEVVR